METSDGVIMKVLSIVLGIIILITTVWSSLEADKFQNYSLQMMGGIVFAVMLVTFGLRVDAKRATRSSLLSGFVMIVGTAFVAREICVLTYEISQTGGDFMSNVVVPSIGIAMGFVLSWASGYLSGLKESRHINKIWLLLVLSFVLMCATVAVDIWDLVADNDGGTVFYVVLGGFACYLVIFIYGLAAILSRQTRSSIGVTIGSG